MIDIFLLSIYADRQWQAEIKDVVWEHGENLYPGWRCNYCRAQKGGGGATRLKQHLAGRGAEVVHCQMCGSTFNVTLRGLT